MLRVSLGARIGFGLFRRELSLGSEVSSLKLKRELFVWDAHVRTHASILKTVLDCAERLFGMSGPRSPSRSRSPATGRGGDRYGDRPSEGQSSQDDLRLKLRFRMNRSLELGALDHFTRLQDAGGW